MPWALRFELPCLHMLQEVELVYCANHSSAVTALRKPWPSQLCQPLRFGARVQPLGSPYKVSGNFASDFLLFLSPVASSAIKCSRCSPNFCSLFRFNSLRKPARSQSVSLYLCESTQARALTPTPHSVNKTGTPAGSSTVQGAGKNGAAAPAQTMVSSQSRNVK